MEESNTVESAPAMPPAASSSPVVSEAALAPSSPSASPAASADSNEAAEDADFSPVLSKSARRRQARKMGAWRAEEAMVLRSPSTPSFRPPADATHLQVHHASAVFRSPDAARTNSTGNAYAINALADMFPSLERDVLSALLVSCGSFDAVVEYVLTSDAAAEREASQMQRALDASLLAASSSPSVDGGVVSCSPPVASFDHLSSLPLDLLLSITSHLDLFDLASLSRSNRDLRSQVDAHALGSVDSLDFSRARFSGWSDWRMVLMIQRFVVTSLSLRNTAFRSFADLTHACFGRQVRSLSLEGCAHLEDHDLAELFGLGEHLTSLDLAGTDITDDGLEQIATASENRALTKIVLTGCRFISSTGVNRVLDQCPSLRELHLMRTNVARSVLHFSTQAAASLQVINLSSCRKLPAELTLTSRFCALTALNLSANPQLRDATIAVPTLTRLNLGNSKHLERLALEAPKLTTLNLAGCALLARVVPVPGWSDVFSSRLVSLNANGCRSLTSLAFASLVGSARGTLETLACRGCILLTDHNLDLLVREHAEPHAANAISDLPAAASADADAPPPPGARLTSLDLSGCRSTSSAMVAQLHRQAESTRAAFAAEVLRRSERDGLVAVGAGATTKDERWRGGLDDDDDDEEGDQEDGDERNDRA